MIPNNPMMLLSYVNMKLRDDYNDLDEMCKSLALEKQELIDKLAGIGYTYQKENNQFV